MCFCFAKQLFKDALSVCFGITLTGLGHNHSFPRSSDPVASVKGFILEKPFFRVVDVKVSSAGSPVKLQVTGTYSHPAPL
jgi:hypothetical protein